MPPLSSRLNKFVANGITIILYLYNILHSKKLDVNMSLFGVGLDVLFPLICIRKVVIIESKAKITQQKISDCNGD